MATTLDQDLTRRDLSARSGTRGQQLVAGAAPGAAPEIGVRDRSERVITVHTDELGALVASLIVPSGDLIITQRVSGDVVEVRVASAPEGPARRRALISTPGDWWVALRVDDGYADSMLLHEPTAEELTECVRRCLRAAEHYVRRGGTPMHVGRMRWPALRVDGDSGNVVLPRIVSEQLRTFLRARPSTGATNWF